MFLFTGIVNLLHIFNFIDIGRYLGYSLLFPLPFIAFLLNKALRSSYVNLDKAERLTKLSVYGAICSIVWIIGGIIFLNEEKNLIIPVAIILYFGIFAFPTLFYIKGLSVKSFYPLFDVKTVKKLMVYGIPLYLATFAGLLSGHLDKLIVINLSDNATFAVFSVGAFQIPVFAMLSAAFSQQIFPKMIRHIEDGEEEEAKEIWLKTTKKISLITYPIILIVMFFAEEIIFFIYSYNYEGSIVLFKTYLLVALFRNNSYGILLTAKGHTKSIALLSVAILVINFIISIILYYYFGLQGIVFGTLLSTFLFTSFILFNEGMIISYLRNIVFTRSVGIFSLLILIAYFLA
jgi:O-antigen/teichoic acid export membrane protein